jgi:hypothetical protein
MAFAISVSNALGFAHMTTIDRFKPTARGGAAEVMKLVKRITSKVAKKKR